MTGPSVYIGEGENIAVIPSDAVGVGRAITNQGSIGIYFEFTRAIATSVGTNNYQVIRVFAAGNHLYASKTMATGIADRVSVDVHQPNWRRSLATSADSVPFEIVLDLWRWVTAHEKVSKNEGGSNAQAFWLAADEPLAFPVAQDDTVELRKASGHALGARYAQRARSAWDVIAGVENKIVSGESFTLNDAGREAFLETAIALKNAEGTSPIGPGVALLFASAGSKAADLRRYFVGDSENLPKEV